MDHFKVINDTPGHASGDAALLGLAHCLSEVVRDSDTVSRRGGDEFLLSLTEIAAISDVTRVAATINAELRAPGLYSRMARKRSQCVSAQTHIRGGAMMSSFKVVWT